MTERRAGSPLSLYMVDVFGGGAMDGNPVAVVVGGEGLGDDEMARITQWFDLSETVFLLPATSPDADYRARIFTPGRELPFAGHPTLGVCHVFAELSGNGGESFVQECGAGLVSLHRTQDGLLSFAAPPLVRSGPASASELDEAVRVLGIETDDVIDAAWIDNGPGWLGVRLASSAEVLDVTPAGSWPTEINIGLVGPHESGDAEVDFEVRAFFSAPDGSIREDPVTGSLGASVAMWLRESGVVDGSYVAAQGTALGRNGRVRISYDDEGRAWVAGETFTHASGSLDVGRLGGTSG